MTVIKQVFIFSHTFLGQQTPNIKPSIKPFLYFRHKWFVKSCSLLLLKGRYFLSNDRLLFVCGFLQASSVVVRHSCSVLQRNSWQKTLKESRANGQVKVWKSRCLACQDSSDTSVWRRHFHYSNPLKSYGHPDFCFLKHVLLLTDIPYRWAVDAQIQTAIFLNS